MIYLNNELLLLLKGLVPDFQLCLMLMTDLLSKLPRRQLKNWVLTAFYKKEYIVLRLDLHLKPLLNVDS